MKQLTKAILLIVAGLSVQTSKAEQRISLKNKTFYSVLHHFLRDTTFDGNYVAAGGKTYLYSKPDLAFRTKTKVPQNVLLIVTKKSGAFVYGKFNISSSQSFKGWFRLSDLKEISFSAPKIN